MKIAQIHNKYKEIGGEDIVVEREKKLLQEAGHDVVQYFVSNNDIISTKEKIYTSLSICYSLKFKKKVSAFLERELPDVVHVHNFLPILSPSVFFAASQLNIPLVLTIHNFRLLCINGLLYRNNKTCENCISKKVPIDGIKYGCYQNSKVISIFPTISNSIHTFMKTWQLKIDKVIFLSEFSKGVFSRSHISFRPEQMNVKPNFLEDKGFLYDKQDYFLYVGRISEEKGILTVIESFLDSGKTIKIAGTGPLQEKVLAYSKTHKNIIYLGFQEQQQLKDLYLHAKATIFASKMYEGLGLVVIESFSFGTPVIGPDFGNSGQLIKENYNGNKYELGNVTSLSEVIRLFEENQNQKELRKNARITFEEKFTAQKNLQILEKIYSESIENKKLNNS